MYIHDRGTLSTNVQSVFLYWDYYVLWYYSPNVTVIWAQYKKNTLYFDLQKICLSNSFQINIAT